MFNSKIKARLECLENRMRTRVDEHDFHRNIRQLYSDHKSLELRHAQLQDNFLLLLDTLELTINITPAKREYIKKVKSVNDKI